MRGIFRAGVARGRGRFVAEPRDNVEDGAPKEPAPDASGEGSPAGGPAGERGSPEPVVEEVSPPMWRELWQAPALVGSVVLLGAAAYLSVATRPKVDYEGLLRRGEILIEQGKPLEAIDELNARVFPFEAKGELPGAARARYYLLLARAMYQGQRQLEVDNAENHQRILRAFGDAEASGAVLEDHDRESIARTQLALGRADLAAEVAGRISDARSDRRHALLRRAIELELSRAREDYGPALRLMERMLDDPTLDDVGRAWITQRQTDVLIERGYEDEAIAKLLRELQRLGGVDDRTRAELLLSLARAYVDVGAPARALEQLGRVAALLGASDDRMGEALWLEGMALEAMGEGEDARERLLAVLVEYPSSAAVIPALLEVAQIEARLDEGESAVHHFERLVEVLLSGRRHPRVARERVVESLVARSAEVAARGRWDLARRLGRLAEDLFEDGEPTAAVLAAIARAERGMALSLMGFQNDPIGTLAGEQGRDLRSLDPATREEARRHLIAAGSMFLRHARTQVVGDYAAFGASLFLAGDSFDRAGDQSEAINAFQEYVEAFPDDPRRAEARLRLAQAFEARGETELAIEGYRSLIADAKDPATVNVGIFGDLSYVPLARLLARDGDSSNDAEAEELLRAIVDGVIVRDPDTALYRDGVFELGSLLLERGRYEEAIATLSEALERFAGDPREIEARYRLAEASRMDAQRIEEELGRAIPASEREALEATRRTRLETARDLFARTIEELSAIDGRRLGLARGEMLRNSMYFRAASVRALGDAERAVELYDEAYARFPEDPASLVALTQIVSVRLEQGDFERALVSNERAKRFFESLPEDVWDDPYLPMGRDEWEAWLNATTELAGVDDG